MIVDAPIQRCQGARTDPEWWFADDKPTIERARSLCRWCPLAKPCFERGWSEPDGIWGGVTHKERVMLAGMIGKAVHRATIRARVRRGRDYKWPTLAVRR